MDEHKRKFAGFVLPLVVIVICLFYSLDSKSQNCPPNMDFEAGTFDQWGCFAGFTTTIRDTENYIVLRPSGGPAPGHHTMYSSTSKEVDYYAGFPVVCPNGSGHS